MNSRMARTKKKFKGQVNKKYKNKYNLNNSDRLLTNYSL